MAQRVSPGIYTNELQFTEVAVEISRTTPCIIGGATKGPLNTPVRVTSEQDLVRNFGKPVESDYGLLAAVQYLKQGNSLVYLRVADSAVATSLTNYEGKPTAVAGVKATGSVTLTANPQDGDTVVLNDGTNPAKTFEFDRAIAATGTVTFTGLPSDGETIIIPDGFVSRTFEFDAAAAGEGDITIAVGNAADGDKVTLIDSAGRTVVFEFDNNAALTGDVAVTIGADNNASAANLASAINDHPTLDISASAASNVVTVTQGTVGAAGNTTITVSGANISKNDFTGGEDLAAGTPGNIPVLLGATATECATNLAAAVEAQVGFRVSATSALGVVTLTNDVPGAAGNVSITEGLANATATGMSGGQDAGVTGSNVAVTIGSTAAATAVNLRAAINAQSTLSITAQENLSGANPVVNLTHDAETASGNVTITESTSTARITVAGMSGGVTPQFGSNVDVLAISAATPGSWGDGVRVSIQPTTVMGAPAGRFDIIVEAPVDNAGTLQIVERFRNMTNADAASPRYVETVVNEGVRGEVRPSSYISASSLQPYEPNAVTSIALGADTAGNDGISGLTSADFIGSTAGNTATGLKAAENAERVDFNVLLVPGNSHKDVIDAMIATAEFRGDCVVLIDPPFGLTVNDVVDWHNGTAFDVPNSPTAPINTNVAIIYWSWVKVFSDYLEKNIWMPPSVAALSVFAFADENPGPWLAPAGHQRGVVPFGSDVEYSPLQAQRDLLLGGNNRINPIVEFISQTSETRVLYGNVTATRTPGPLDAIHVKRMVIYAKKLISTAVRFLHFDPNDDITRRSFEQLVNPILQAIQDARGLERFVVKCDAENNPPEVRAQKKLVGQILLRHIDASEVIEIDFALFSTGAEFAA